MIDKIDGMLGRLRCDKDLLVFNVATNLRLIREGSYDQAQNERRKGRKLQN